MRPVESDRVVVFDTTLRDGEQAPGFSMNAHDKVRMAGALRDLGVDVIEAGFAAASPGDEEAIRRVAGEIEGPILCSLSRASEPDIDASARALTHARRKRCHVFIATSAIHRRAKLKMDCAQVLARAASSVAYARAAFEDVEFSAEDALRTEPEFLAEVMQAAAEAGAATLNVPDTVGYATPAELTALFRYLREKLAAYPHVRLSAHCHDDLGMAVANSLAAVQGGARQVECTINGIGERAGNCALEEVVMALRVRADQYGLDTGVDATRLVATSRLLRETTKSQIARNKAVVGENAFAHEAGIHQHGMLCDTQTYEIMRPQDVGFDQSNLVLGKHSGRHALVQRAQALGFVLGDNGLAVAFAAFKRRADEIGEVGDAELLAILSAVSASSAPRPEELRNAAVG